MASYVDSTLINDERVLHRGHVSKWSLAPRILVGFVLLAAFGLGLLVWLWAYIVYKTTELAITDKRVIAKRGLIARDTMEMFLGKVESIQVDQSVLGRMFNYGTVIISGTGVHSTPFRNIADPLGFRKAFMSAADNFSRTAAPAQAPRV